jgi:hypothetical protein
MKYLLFLTFVGFSSSNPPNFDYDFSGFDRLTKLLATNCSNIENQVYNDYNINSERFMFFFQLSLNIVSTFNKIFISTLVALTCWVPTKANKITIHN